MLNNEQVNREIQYKGKRIDNDEWVYGYYVKAKYEQNTAHLIYVNLESINSKNKVCHPVEVYSESVCQCTGLVDRVGTRIFEKDIVKLFETDNRCEFVGYVAFEKGRYVIRLSMEPTKYGYYEKYRSWDDGEHDWYSLENEDFDLVEVIDNVVDNPTLIGAKGGG